MNEQQIQQIIRKQRSFFHKNATLDIEYRIHALERLRKCIKKYETEIHDAIRVDLGKSAFESYMCETGLVYSEISYMIRHTPAFAREKTVLTPLAQFHSRSFKKPSPYGAVLIMSPWNYPFLLTIDPLVDAIAAGNTVVLKPSAYSPHTSDVIVKIIKKCFSPEYVTVVTGGRAENTCLLEQDFDYIFFTGSQTVGKEVMRKASAHLTPITLELGGKSPCIVDKTANLKLAAKRIVFGKYLNCGQTCVAPDYIYCDAMIKDDLVTEIKKQIRKQYSKEPLTNPDYGKIINEKHFTRLCSLIKATGSQRIICGGKSDSDTLKIEPTVLDVITFHDAVMQEEMFGPILPVLTYSSLDQAIQKVNSLLHPLALYLFTSDKAAAKRVTTECGFGGGCINDTIIHLATSEMGFGGFGTSGMGSYHGKDGFNTFSHTKSIVDKKTWLDLPMRYQPYRSVYDKMIHLFLR
ncbi:MAG: aldehyde dehydrogenase [Clostridiales bacterium]|nr:aldehyde dehydrogenase [Clostridiales bacterium]